MSYRRRTSHILNVREVVYPNIAEVLSDTPETSRRLAEATQKLVPKSNVISNMLEESLFARRGHETRLQKEALQVMQEFGRYKENLERRREGIKKNADEDEQDAEWIEETREEQDDCMERQDESKDADRLRSTKSRSPGRRSSS